MKRKIIVLDDELAKELETFPNQSEVVRTALRVYISHISPEMINGMRLSYVEIKGRLAGIENAVSKIADAASTSIDKHSEWGA